MSPLRKKVKVSLLAKKSGVENLKFQNLNTALQKQILLITLHEITL